jgi:hypothetical protein
VRTNVQSSDRLVPVELYVPENRRNELHAAWREVVTGRPVRLEALQRDVDVVTWRATRALQKIAKAIRDGTDGEQGYRLTWFLASLYNGYEFPFDPREFRELDTELASACLDYLNFDRLGLGELLDYLPGGETQLQRWITQFRIERPRMEAGRERERSYESEPGDDGEEEGESQSQPE